MTEANVTIESMPDGRVWFNIRVESTKKEMLSKRPLAAGFDVDEAVTASFPKLRDLIEDAHNKWTKEENQDET